MIEKVETSAVVVGVTPGEFKGVLRNVPLFHRLPVAVAREETVVTVCRRTEHLRGRVLVLGMLYSSSAISADIQ